MEGGEIVTLEEYAKLHPVDDVDAAITALESELWQTDYRNDPPWVIRQNEHHNRKIMVEIRKLREAQNHGGC